jgi:phosphatidate cytidylyltransferase
VLGQRVLTAVVGIPLLVAVVGWAPAWLFAGVVTALALLAQWELYRMFARVGVQADWRPGLLFGAVVVGAFDGGGRAEAWFVSLALSIAVVGCLALSLRRPAGPGPGWAGTALTLLGICYCAWLLGHVIWLRALRHGMALTFFLLAVTWAGETAAYFVGRRWGRRRLAPRVSPGKTVEGAVAQVVASLGAAAVAAWVAPAGLPVPLALGAGLTLGVIGQVGDLAESYLKRSAETKDAGDLLPGHGGLLDRLDSLLFNAPALYYYVKLLTSSP